MNMSWNCGRILATAFVLVNLLGQLGGVVMVLARLRVQIACGLLFFIVVLQVSELGVIFGHSTGDERFTSRRSLTQFCGIFSSCSEIWLSSVHCCLSSQSRAVRRAHSSQAFQAWARTNRRTLCSSLVVFCSHLCSSR